MYTSLKLGWEDALCIKMSFRVLSAHWGSFDPTPFDWQFNQILNHRWEQTQPPAARSAEGRVIE